MSGYTTIIDCENIHKTYLLGIEGVPALRGATMDVRAGEFLVILGTSGGGKSTLLNILGSIDVPTKGNLMILDRRITDRTPDGELARLRCKHIGFVFQSFNLISTMTAEENVSLPMIIDGTLNHTDIKKRAQELLMQVGLGHRMNHYPSMLSGGEQQRVTIARSLANNPEILLLDEPTGDLDTKNTHIILNILLSLNRQRGLTMVMVTHDVYMKPFAHRVLYMRDGKVAHVEECHKDVYEQSYEDLKRTVEDQVYTLGEHEEKSDAVTGRLLRTHVRKMHDYATATAQRPLCITSNSETQRAVEILFGVRCLDDCVGKAHSDDYATAA